MIIVPFVYFGLMSLYLYKKRKNIDIAVIIALIFAVSGFFSILIDMFGLRYDDAIDYQISFKATVAYCGLLSICLIPFAKNSHLYIHNIRPLRKVDLLKSLAWVSVIWFTINTVLSFQSIMNVLTGDMLEYRSMMYEGEVQVSWMSGLPSSVRFIVAVVNSIFGCKWTLMFMAFFSSFVQKLPRKYFLLFMLASLSGPINGIIGADRSATAYWIMSLFAMYLFFRPFMEQKEKQRFRIFAFIMVGLLSIYLLSMTIARFAERDYGNALTGVQGGLITYLGQSFINFCLFFDNYEPPFSHFGLIFPFIYQHVLGIPSGAVTIQQLMSDMTGYRTGVFYTFIGHIIMAAGRTVAIIYCIVYSVISQIATSRITHNGRICADHFYIYFALASVLYLGFFVYYYASFTTTVGLLSMFILLKLMK